MQRLPGLCGGVLFQECLEGGVSFADDVQSVCGFVDAKATEIEIFGVFVVADFYAFDSGGECDGEFFCCGVKREYVLSSGLEFVVEVFGALGCYVSFGGAFGDCSRFGGFVSSVSVFTDHCLEQE